MQNQSKREITLDTQLKTALSETYRIRIVPSLTILQLIQDSPADYHSRSDPCTDSG